MSIAVVGEIVNMLVTVLDTVESEMRNVLPFTIVEAILNSVDEPSLKTFIQLRSGRGRPSNEQLSEIISGLII